MLTTSPVTMLSDDVLRNDAPQLHRVLENRQGEPIGRCSLWWGQNTTYQSHRVGMIGHVAALEASSARAVMRFACQQLAAQGCTLAVGPMDGSTWRNYRAVIADGERPPFFLEPQNPLDWASYFTTSGFEPVAQYFSAETTDLGNRLPLLEKLGNRFAAQSIAVEAVQPHRLDEVLCEIYSIVINTFRHNLFYSPLEKSQYLQQYRQLSQRVTLDCVLIARRRGEPVGFVFALPDLLQQHRGEAIDTLIIKSIGVSPGIDNAGIGQLLLATVGQRAAELGYRRIIHALMRDIPRLRRLSSRDAIPMRRYALFAKVLGS